MADLPEWLKRQLGIDPATNRVVPPQRQVQNLTGGPGAPALRPGAAGSSTRPVQRPVRTRQQIIRDAARMGGSTGDAALDAALGLGAANKNQQLIAEQNQRNQAALRPDIISYINQRVQMAPPGSRLNTSANELAALTAIATANRPEQEQLKSKLTTQYKTAPEQFQKEMDRLSRDQIKLARDILNQGKAPGEPGADPWAALKAFGNPKTTEGLSGNRYEDAETLRRLRGLGYDLGGVIRRKFVPVPGQAEPSQEPNTIGPQESPEDFQKRLDAWYSQYAAKFMEAIQKPRGELGTKSTIEDAKMFAVGETMSGLDPAIQNAIRNEQLGYQQEDREGKEFEKQLKKESENPLNLPDFLIARGPTGMSVADFIPGINIANIAASTLKQKSTAEAQLELATRQSELVMQAEKSRRAGDQKAYNNLMSQANSLTEGVGKLGAMAEAQTPQKLNTGTIIGESLMAGLSAGAVSGIGRGALKGSLRSAVRGIKQDAQASKKFAAGRAIGQVAAGQAGISAGAYGMGAGYGALTGKPVGDTAEEFAKGSLGFGLLGLRGIRENAAGRAVKSPEGPFKFMQTPISLSLPRAKKTPEPKTVKTEDVPGTLRRAQLAARDALSPGTRFGKMMAPIRRLNQELFDPAAPLYRIDRAKEKKLGRKLKASESLEALFDLASTSRAQAQAILSRPKVQDVIRKNDQDLIPYMVTKSNLEKVRNGKKNELVGENNTLIDIESQKRFVSEYEKRNKTAKKDADIMREVLREEQGRQVKEGMFPEDEFAFLQESEPNWAPTNKVLPKDLERPEMDSRTMGSISEQTSVREKQGSMLPTDVTPRVIEDRLTQAITERNRARLAKLFAQRVQEGHANGKIILSPEQASTRKGLLQLSRDANALRDSLKPLVGKSRRQGAVARSQRRQSEQEAASKARSLLRSVVKGNDAKAAISSLSRKDLLEVFDNIFDQRTPGTVRLGKKVTNRRAKEQALKKELAEVKNQLDELHEVSRGAREGAWELAPDSTTGKPTISGIDDGGMPFKIEVDPEIYRTMQGLGAKPNKVLESIRRASTPFRSAFTGWLNPLFTITSFVLYDPAATAVAARGGSRLLISPKAIAAGIKSFSKEDSFTRVMQEAGMQRSTASMLPESIRSPEYFPEGRTLANKIATALRHPKRLSDAIDEQLGKFMQSSRIRIARWEYENAKNKGLSESDAIAEAVYAANNSMPNYVRVGRVARFLDSVIPYTAASIAGTRVQLRALRRDKGAYVAKLGMVGVMPSVLVTANNHSTEEGKRFYDDMIASGKESVFDFNHVIVLPGAQKNEKTGEWEGIIKIPVAPEFRSVNKLAWRQMRDAVNKNGMSDPLTYAGAVVDYLTGGTLPITVAGTRGSDKSLQGGLLKSNDARIEFSKTSSNPLANLVIGLTSNVDPFSGREIVPTELKNEKRQDQKYPKTSKLAIWLGDRLNLAPLQAQYIVSSFGLPGKVFQGAAEGDPFKPIVDKFVGARGMSSGAQFFALKNELAQNMKSRLNKERLDTLYAENTEKSILDSAERALQMLNSMKSGSREYYNAVKALNEFSKAKGEIHDPFFDDKLPDGTPVNDTMRVQQLLYAASKPLVSAKQSYSKEGNPLYTELGLEQPNQQALFNERGKFFTQLGILGNSSSPVGAPETFSGASEPTTSLALKSFQAQYFGTPKGSRSGMLSTPLGQQLKDLWKADNEFTNKERMHLGLKPLKPFEEFSSGGSGGGRSGGRRRRGKSDGRKAKRVSLGKAKKAKKGKKVTFKKTAPKTKSNVLNFLFNQ